MCSKTLTIWVVSNTEGNAENLFSIGIATTSDIETSAADAVEVEFSSNALTDYPQAPPSRNYYISSYCATPRASEPPRAPSALDDDPPALETASSFTPTRTDREMRLET